MFGFNEFSALHCTTTFSIVYRTVSNTIPASTTPYTRSQARVAAQSDLPKPAYTAPQPVSRPTKKRRRQPEFLIFEDAPGDENQPARTLKKPKAGARTPLSEISFGGNITPAPSPRLPPTPFPLLPEDPMWQNLENYDPNPLPTPPPTPSSRTSVPTPPAGPPPLPPPAPRIHPFNVATRARSFPPPLNMVLYELLGLKRWRVSKAEIVAAFKQAALHAHPDHCREEEREQATEKMQKINAAKEVLSDRQKRREYHLTGALPWAE
ncbi:DnaJ-domain-containing protein [Setomelanomma holmii]|uniref:DnaJ-domain-containing protein n=1 Tax=Setomelanomma holmii TaxID=210430 RepID=A0A9P4H2L9_9PLEO|nr:DnaJ-domain-containing protein [Setomelanomma holmii]